MELVTKQEAYELTQGLATWSDEKRAEFVKLFNKRSNTGRILLLMTAEEILASCWRRKILASRHVFKFVSRWGGACSNDRDINLRPQYRHEVLETDRTSDELGRIARERADNTLESLPPLQKALSILDPGTLAKMKRRDVLIGKGEQLVPQLEEMSESIRMSDHLDLNVAQFLELVAARNVERLKLVRELNKIGREGRQLEEEINKALFKGIPGLSDAVVDVCEKMMQQATSMGEMYRRVEERVRFGDSLEAMAILERFEKDEMTVDTDLAARLRAALDKLKIAKPVSKRMAK